MKAHIVCLIIVALSAAPRGMTFPTPLALQPEAGMQPRVLRVADSAEVRILVKLLPRPEAYNVITAVGSTKGQPARSVAFRFIIEGAPTAKSYQLWYQDMGMKAEGLPPAPIPNDRYRFTVDAAGNWKPRIPSFHVVNWIKGEWLDFWVRSTDGEVFKGVRFTPLP